MNSMLRQSLPILAIILGGAWLDTTGHGRALAVFAIFGEMLATSVNLLGVLSWKIPVQIQIVAEATIGGIVGARSLFEMVSTFVISARSKGDRRTSRLSYLFTALLGATALATALSGIMLETLGFDKFFIAVICMHLFSLFLLLLLVKDEPMTNKKDDKWCRLYAVKPIFKSRHNNIVLWLMLINSVLLHSNFSGEGNLLLYYLQRTFKMSASNAGLYFSYRLSILIISSVVVTPFLVEHLKWSDLSLGIFTSFLSMLSAIYATFMRSELELIISASFDILRSSVFVVSTSVYTKCLKKEELGIFMSLITIGNSLVPLIFLPLYNYVFRNTINILPGAFFLINAVSSFVCMLLFSIGKFLYKDNPKIQEKEEVKIQKEVI